MAAGLRRRLPMPLRTSATGGKRTSARYNATVSKPRATLRLCMSVSSRTLTAYAAIFSMSACNGGNASDEIVGGVDRPNLAYALAKASGQGATGVEPKLLYERCSKRTPVVEPRQQKWFCRFGFSTSEGEQDCSVVISIHPDDHWGVWKPDLELDPSTGRVSSTLACMRRGTDT